MKHIVHFVAAWTLLVAAGFAQVQDLGAPFQASSTATSVSDDGLVVGGVDSLGTPFVWTESTGYVALDVSPFLQIAQNLLVSGDGAFAAATLSSGHGRSVVRWDLATGAVAFAGPMTAVYAISDDGSTLVGITSYYPTIRCCRWTAAGGYDEIGSSIGYRSAATDVSTDGSVIVGYILPFGTLGWVPFRWTTAGGMQLLSSLPGEREFSVKVSADGNVLGCVFRASSTAPSRAYRWTVMGGFQDLGTITGGDMGIYDFMLSRDGNVLAGTEYNASLGFAIGWRWTQGSGILRLSPQPNFWANGISSDGSVLSCEERTPQGQLPARWTVAGGAEYLPTLRPNLPLPSYTSDLHVSADGSTIAGTSALSAPEHHAVVWRADGSIGRSLCGPAVPNSTGTPGSLRLTGSNRIDQANLILQGTALPLGSFGIAICSRSNGLVMNPGGSQGTLCLSGPIGRFVAPGQIISADASGQFSLTLDPAIMAQPNGSVIPTYGESWTFQTWYRDANPTPTSNFTNAATVRFY